VSDAAIVEAKIDPAWEAGKQRDFASAVADLFDRSWVVSLPGSSDRRGYINAYLPSRGLRAFQFFDATPAEDPAIADLFARGLVATYPPCFRCGKLDCGRPNCNNVLIPAQVATFWTFLQLCRRVADGPAESVMVMEDDVVFHDYAPKILNRLAARCAAGNLPIRGRAPFLLRLGRPLGDDHDEDCPFRLHRRVEMSNYCFGMNRAFAREAVARFSRIDTTADIYLHRDVGAAVGGVTVDPPIASDLSFSRGEMRSLIHPKPAFVVSLRKAGREAEAEAYAKVVAAHIKKRHHRPLLITGHPRCGSTYMAHLCRQLGLDVGHERDGAHGISSWMMAVDDPENPYSHDEIARSRLRLHWDDLILYVRDLRTAVPSVMRDILYARHTFDFRQRHVKDALGVDLSSSENPVEQAVLSITTWTQLVLAQRPALTVRVETDHAKLVEFLIRRGLVGEDAKNVALDVTPKNIDKPYKRVVYPKPEVAQRDWAALSGEVVEAITWYNETFGYASVVQ
jgi:hypothetical protein